MAEDFIENKLSTFIIEKRKELGMSREEFAKFAGLSKSAVSSYETGKSIPDTVNAVRLAKLLDIDIMELLSYINQPETYNEIFNICCYDLKEGSYIKNSCEYIVKTSNIRKNEDPDRHICISDGDKYMLFMMKKNHMGKKPLVLIRTDDCDNIRLARLIDDRIFHVDNYEEIKNARIIAQFKRFIKVQ